MIAATYSDAVRWGGFRVLQALGWNLVGFLTPPFVSERRNSLNFHIKMGNSMLSCKPERFPTLFRKRTEGRAGRWPQGTRLPPACSSSRRSGQARGTRIEEGWLLRSR